MKNKRITKNKYVRFFLPIPSLIFLIFFGIVAAWAEIDGAPISAYDWFLLMISFFIFYIIPIDILIWIIKKIYYNIKNPVTKNIREKGAKASNSSKYSFSPYHPIAPREDKKVYSQANSPKRDYINNAHRYDANINTEDIENYYRRPLKKSDIKDIMDTASYKCPLNQDNTGDPDTKDLQGIAGIIYQSYREFGINISISRADVHKHHVMYRIVPLSGVKAKTIFSLKDDVALRLGTEIDMEMFSSLGCIGIILPINYFSNIPKSIYDKIHSSESNVNNNEPNQI